MRQLFQVVNKGATLRSDSACEGRGRSLEAVGASSSFFAETNRLPNGGQLGMKARRELRFGRGDAADRHLTDAPRARFKKLRRGVHSIRFASGNAPL